MKSASASHDLKLSKRDLRRAREAVARRNRRFFAVGVTGLVLLLAVAVAFTRSDVDGSDSGIRQTAGSTIEGEGLPTFTHAGPDQGLGRPIPRVKGESFDGDPVEIAIDGDPKMLIFLAHWCPHCQAEVPVIQSWLDSQGLPAGVDLISVSTAVDATAPNYPPSEWLEQERWQVPVMADDETSSIGKAFGVASYPYFVFVDSDGKVVHRASGELPIAEIESHLSRLSK